MTFYIYRINNQLSTGIVDSIIIDNTVLNNYPDAIEIVADYNYINGINVIRTRTIENSDGLIGYHRCFVLTDVSEEDLIVMKLLGDVCYRINKTYINGIDITNDALERVV